MPAYFFIENLTGKSITLDEDTSKHVISVLRMKRDEKLLLTDGKGKLAECTITDDNRKRTVVSIVSEKNIEPLLPEITIAVSLVKNSSRFEWFLEKATEIGINRIIPLICERTEKEKFRFERMHGLLISAMLQSQQSWLPVLDEPVNYKKVLDHHAVEKFIAHCAEGERKPLPQSSGKSRLILIGPEGDFTNEEISLALQHDFIPVTLGKTRLRTETAGMVAASLLRNH
jgi:16S rRNA (uracil1498-N3)-methyltransferase